MTGSNSFLSPPRRNWTGVCPSVHPLLRGDKFTNDFSWRNEILQTDVTGHAFNSSKIGILNYFYSVESLAL